MERSEPEATIALPDTPQPIALAVVADRWLDGEPRHDEDEGLGGSRTGPLSRAESV